MPERKVPEHSPIPSLERSLLNELISSKKASQRSSDSSHFLAWVQTTQAAIPTTGLQLLHLMRDSYRLLPTGCEGLDKLLCGGLREGHVTELVGDSCSGKTDLCHLAASRSALRNERVLYVDTTNSFSPVRLSQLCSAATYASQQGLIGGEDALSNVHVVKPHNIHELLSCIDELSLQLGQLQEPSLHPKLLIIDSVSSILSPVLSNKHNQGYAIMVALSQYLKYFAIHRQMAILVTNTTTSAGKSNFVPFMAATKPALGEKWRVQPSVRIRLCNHGENRRSATLVSSMLAECGQEVWFMLTDGGAVAL